MTQSSEIAKYTFLNGSLRPHNSRNTPGHAIFVEYKNPLVVSFEAILNHFKPNLMTQF